MDLVKLVFQRGGTSGANLALHHAVVRGNIEIASWLIEDARPDINSKNYQGKSPLTVATERKDEKMAQLLKQHGGML